MRRIAIVLLVSASIVVAGPASGTPSDTWSGVETVAPAKVGPRTGAQLQAVDMESGATLVVWSTSSDSIYAAKRNANGQWSAPERIAALRVDPRFTKLELRLEAHGTQAELVWMSEPICDCEGKNHVAFSARSFAEGSGWSQPRAVMTARNHYVLGWDMAVTAGGVAAIVWEDETSKATQVAYRWQTSNGAWHSPTTLAGPYPRGRSVGQTQVLTFVSGFLRAADGSGIKLSFLKVTNRVGAAGLSQRPHNEVIYMSVGKSGALGPTSSVLLASGVQPLLSKASISIGANGYPVIAYGAGSGWDVVRRRGPGWVRQQLGGAKGPSIPFLFALPNGREVAVYGGYGLVSSARDAQAGQYLQLGTVGSPRAATVPTQDDPVAVDSADGALLFFWADSAGFDVSTLAPGGAQWIASGQRLPLQAGHLVYRAAALKQDDGSVLLVFLDQRSSGSRQTAYSLKSSTYEP